MSIGDSNNVAVYARYVTDAQQRGHRVTIGSVSRNVAVYVYQMQSAIEFENVVSYYVRCTANGQPSAFETQNLFECRLHCQRKHGVFLLTFYDDFTGGHVVHEFHGKIRLSIKRSRSLMSELRCKRSFIGIEPALYVCFC